MNRATALSLVFLGLALSLSAWLLLRPRAPSVDDTLAAVGPASERVGMTFAEWSVRSDAVLLADIDPGKGVSTDPRSFLVVHIQPDGHGGAVATDGPTFSWAPPSRGDTAGKLFGLGFRVNAEGRAFIPPPDPLFSDPVARSDASVDQVVKLRAKGGATATLVRKAGDPQALPNWNRRALGFPSEDGRLVYVSPDAVVLPMKSP